MSDISPKVYAASIGAALATIVCAILAGLGYQPDTVLQGAITVVIVFALGYSRVDPTRSAKR
jgi:hypothetical protein